MMTLLYYPDFKVSEKYHDRGIIFTKMFVTRIVLKKGLYFPN